MTKYNSNTFNYTIQENDRTVKGIMRENLNFSARLSKKLEISNEILLNGKTVKLNKSVFKGDVLTVGFPDETDEYESVKMQLDILYEDSSMLIVNKPAFMVVHPTRTHQDDTLANGVRYYFDKNGIKRKIRLVNRLDMNTTGIVIIAKNSYVHNELSEQMKAGTVDKYYYAVVEGILENDEGIVDKPIARLNPDDIKRVVDDSGKQCITLYKAEKKLNNMTLVKLKLETGRTHQIRVHMNYLGHPVVGDTLYGSESEYIKRQALHCCEMSFIHPASKEPFTVKCQLPHDMAALIG